MPSASIMLTRMALAALYLPDDGWGGSGAVGKNLIGVSCSRAANSQSITPARAIRRVNWLTFSSRDDRSSTKNTDGARTEINKARACLKARTLAGVALAPFKSLTASFKLMPNQ